MQSDSSREHPKRCTLNISSTSMIKTLSQEAGRPFQAHDRSQAGSDTSIVHTQGTKGLVYKELRMRAGCRPDTCSGKG